MFAPQITLGGSPLASTNPSTGLSGCADECTANQECSWFNFDESTGTCELLSRNCTLVPPAVTAASAALATAGAWPCTGKCAVC